MSLELEEETSVEIIPDVKTFSEKKVLFECSNSHLSNSVVWAAQSLSSRSTVAAYSAMRFQIKDTDLNTLHVFSMGKDTSNAIQVPITGANESVDILLAGHAITSYIKIAPQGASTFVESLPNDNSNILFRSGRFKTKLPMLPKAVSMILPDMPSPQAKINGKDFQRAVKRVVLAASPENNSIPVFSGVQFNLDAVEKTITLVATDRYRLDIETFSYEPLEENDFETTSNEVQTNFVLPAKLLDQYAKTFGKEETFTFGVGSSETGNVGVFGISGTDRQATGRLLDGDYPRWQPILDSVKKYEDIKVELSSHAVLQAAKRVAAMSDMTLPVVLTFDDNELSLSSQGDVKSSATDSLPIEYNDKKFECRYNTEYFTDGLSHAEGNVNYTAAYARNHSGDIVESKKSPGVITPVSAEKQGKFIYIIMPLN